MISKLFTTFPPEARLWIFMGERSFHKEEEDYISKKLNDFLPQWNAHGKGLKAEFSIIYQRFIVLVVDESYTMASGCSIDSLTRIFKSLENNLDLKLTNRMLIPFKTSEKIKTLPLNKFAEAVKKGDLPNDTIVFDNSVATLKEFHQKWELPIEHSWAKRYL